MEVFVTGATGLVGRRLVGALLARGDSVTALSRNPSARFPPGVKVLAGDPASAGPWQDALARADACLSLAGDPLLGRWTAAKKRRIRESRVGSTARVAEVVGSAGPRVLVCASAVGFYGDRGDEVLTESSPAGEGFLADTCRDWEAAAAPARARARVVHLRTGIVLARDGGGLGLLVLPFRLLVGGPLGSGRQWQAWIHADDHLALALLALDDPRVEGPLNAVGPEPLTSRDMARAIGRVLGRPSFLPAPELAIRAILGEAAAIPLSSQRAVPGKALDLGFRFRYPTAEEALRDLLGGAG